MSLFGSVLFIPGSSTRSRRLAGMRRVGIGGLQKQAATKETFKEVGQNVAAAQIEQLKAQLEVFKRSLGEFAQNYQKDIKKNPLLRAQFQKMCNTIGVDPLASSKGFWAEMLGVGDFYYELGIQIVESCLVWQEATGGLIDLDVIKKRISRLRSARETSFSDDDIQRAVATLKPLGSGYAIVDLGSRKAIQSLPLELSPDGSRLLALGEQQGYVAFGSTAALGWRPDRFQRAVDGLIQDGLAWLDTQNPGEELYWFPCFFPCFD